jgi:hypothetical protein
MSNLGPERELRYIGWPISVCREVGELALVRDPASLRQGDRTMFFPSCGAPNEYFIINSTRRTEEIESQSRLLVADTS